jgi:site-specific DNA recombinase
MVDPFKFQLEKIINGYSDSTQEETILYKKQVTELTRKMEKLEERWAYGDIDRATFEKFLKKIEIEIRDLEGKYKIQEIEISNLQNRLEGIVDFSQNVSKYWVSGSLNIKKSIQNIIFPEGLVLDTEKRQYLTSRVNGPFSLKRHFMGTWEGRKEKLLTEFDKESSLVAEGGFEPPTFGL